MNTVLVIETASSKPFIYLKTKDKNIFYPFLDSTKVSSSIHGAIDHILKKEGLIPGDLDSIYLGNGPGSYTGMRVGASIAFSFSYSLNIPIVPFCSLMAFTPKSNGSFITVFDARSAGVYLLEGEKTENNISFKEPKKVCMQTFFEIGKEKDFILSPDKDKLEKKAESLPISIDLATPLIDQILPIIEQNKGDEKKNIELLYV